MPAQTRFCVFITIFSTNFRITHELDPMGLTVVDVVESLLDGSIIFKFRPRIWVTFSAFDHGAHQSIKAHCSILTGSPHSPGTAHAPESPVDCSDAPPPIISSSHGAGDSLENLLSRCDPVYSNLDSPLPRFSATERTEKERKVGAGDPHPLKLIKSCVAHLFWLQCWLRCWFSCWRRCWRR